jgi:hypothetical protein
MLCNISTVCDSSWMKTVNSNNEWVIMNKVCINQVCCNLEVACITCDGDWRRNFHSFIPVRTFIITSIRTVRIWVRIGSQHLPACHKGRLNGEQWSSRVRINTRLPLVCCKRWLNGARSFRWDRKPEAPCYSRCNTIKIPSCSKALSAEHRPKSCSSSPVLVTSPYQWKILEWDVKR